MTDAIPMHRRANRNGMVRALACGLGLWLLPALPAQATAPDTAILLSCEGKGTGRYQPAAGELAKVAILIGGPHQPPQGATEPMIEVHADTGMFSRVRWMRATIDWPRAITARNVLYAHVSDVITTLEIDRIDLRAGTASAHARHLIGNPYGPPPREAEEVAGYVAECRISTGASAVAAFDALRPARR